MKKDRVTFSRSSGKMFSRTYIFLDKIAVGFISGRRLPKLGIYSVEIRQVERKEFDRLDRAKAYARKALKGKVAAR